MATELTVDLSRQPHERWLLNPELVGQARRLVDVYFRDMGVTEEVADMVEEMARPILSAELWSEIGSLARQLQVRNAKVLVCNAYYDLIKSIIGCTAFAVDTPAGPLHARNLDWWSENRLLNDTSLLCRFIGAVAGDFVTIGWPGFIGAFSGFAPGRFAVTLNAVISGEPTQIASPVTFLIRAVLSEAHSFQEAVTRLAETPIPSDCLLLVTGTRPGEMVVIERTPTRHAMRCPSGGHVCVTNHYLSMNHETGDPQNELETTSCGRFDRIAQLLHSAPSTLDDCLAYLSDSEVKMAMTVQQMAFRASDGAYSWRA